MKMDLFVLPIMSFLYLMNGIDRSNVGNAAVSQVSWSPCVPDACD
jgi:hypothetical protein